MDSLCHFTFHYASTISHILHGHLPSGRPLHSTMLLLYLQCLYIRPHVQSTLHSTMLLLYRIYCRVGLQYFLLYIPLCFYYIEECVFKCKTKGHFTFHYASTISSQDKYHQNTPLFLYIPLCFYYIASCWRYVLPSLLSLHSTMLLLYRL